MVILFSLPIISFPLHTKWLCVHMPLEYCSYTYRCAFVAPLKKTLPFRRRDVSNPSNCYIIGCCLPIISTPLYTWYLNIALTHIFLSVLPLQRKPLPLQERKRISNHSDGYVIGCLPIISNPLRSNVLCVHMPFEHCSYTYLCICVVSLVIVMPFRRRDVSNHSNCYILGQSSHPLYIQIGYAYP